MIILYRLSQQQNNIKLKMIHKAHSGSHEDSVLHEINHFSTKNDCYSLRSFTLERKAVKANRNKRSNRIIGIILTQVTADSFHIPSYLLPQSNSYSILNNLLI
jgi:hypothetical protein